MKIVILGGGYVGYEIAKQLALEEHDISIVENNKEVFKKISATLDIKPVLGDAVNIDVLKEAELEHANMLIAVTSSDETNIVACQIANFMFNIETKIARISNKSYFMNYELFNKNRFNINLIASPEIEISSVIRRGISTYRAIDIIPCMDDRLRIVGVECTRKSVFLDVPLRYVQNVSNDVEFSILFIERDKTAFIPRKNYVFTEGDIIYFVVKKEDLNKIMSLFTGKDEQMTSVVLIGGTVISEEIVESVLKEDPNVSIKIIEKDIEKAEKLSESFNDIEVLYGDSLDYEIMNESLLKDVSIVISTTNDDKDNILSCLLAKKYGAKRIAAMVSDVTNFPILHTLGINTILDSRKVIISKILHYIKSGSLDNIFTFAGEGFEILSIDIPDNSRGIGLITDDINLGDDILIVALVRDNKIFLNPHRAVINSGDKVLLVTKQEVIPKVTSLFKEKPRYLS